MGLSLAKSSVAGAAAQQRECQCRCAFHGMPQAPPPCRPQQMWEPLWAEWSAAWVRWKSSLSFLQWSDKPHANPLAAAHPCTRISLLPLPAAVALAVLAFLALRPRKGWLRRRQAQPAAGLEAKLADEPTPKASLSPREVSSLPSQSPEVVVGLPLPPGPSDSARGAPAAAGAPEPPAVRSLSLLSAERLAALRALSESGHGSSPDG